MQCGILSLLAAAATARVAAAQELRLGAYVYQAECAPCHGELSYPGGPIYPEPGVNPAFFAGGSYLMQVPPATLRAAILYGVTGTHMNGIGGMLSNQDLEALIAYIESFRR